MATSYKVGSGGSYKIKTGSRMSMESFVRPFDRSQQILQRVIDSRPPERDDSDTDIRWGKPSRFQITDPEQATNPSYVNRSGSNDPNEEEPEEPAQVIDYDEVQRWYFPDKIRIENPDDPEQYVMVQDTQSILFVGRVDGIYRRFNFMQQSE